MKLSRSAALVATLAIATTGALAVSQHDAKAATIATVTTKEPARLYNSEGLLIRNRALAPNSPWLVGKITNFGNEKMYQVATNEYLKASDSVLSDNQPKQKIVGTLTGIAGKFVYNDQINDITGKVIVPGSSWVIGRQVVNKYNQHYVQISAHEYVETTDMTFNGSLPTPVYIGNFDSLDKNPEDDTNNTTIKDYVPNVQRINEYFIKYLNALHAANGTAPVQGSTDMFNYAQVRASQQTNGLDHSTASRDTSENLSSAGLAFWIDSRGVQSDKDIAYNLLKQWYDEDDNQTPVGQPGHFGHRAALIYSGPTVSLGITENAAAFDADWNYSTLDAFNQMYDSQNPQSNFISKDSVQ